MALARAEEHSEKLHDDGPLAHASPEEPTALARPAPGKCEWVQSIVAGYAFENITPKTCTGSVFTYEARRADRTYLIQASALNGELSKVERTSEPTQSADIPDGGINAHHRSCQSMRLRHLRDTFMRAVKPSSATWAGVVQQNPRFKPMHKLPKYQSPRCGARSRSSQEANFMTGLLAMGDGRWAMGQMVGQNVTRLR